MGNIPQHRQPPYSLDLTPCDFFPLQKSNVTWKEKYISRRSRECDVTVPGMLQSMETLLDKEFGLLRRRLNAMCCSFHFLVPVPIFFDLSSYIFFFISEDLSYNKRPITVFTEKLKMQKHLVRKFKFWNSMYRNFKLNLFHWGFFYIHFYCFLLCHNVLMELLQEKRVVYVPGANLTNLSMYLRFNHFSLLNKKRIKLKL